MVLIVVKTSGNFLEYASEILRDNKKIVLTAVKTSGNSLQYASERLRGNKKIVLTAVNSCGYSLKYASERLQDDKEIVLMAIKTSCNTIMYASKRLQDDKLFLIDCYRYNQNMKYYSDFIKIYNKIEENIFNDKIINDNYDILHLVSNIENLSNYLLSNKKYNIIYKNEELQEYIKINKKIIIILFDDINNYSDTEDNIKLEFSKTFKNIGIQVIFI